MSLRPLGRALWAVLRRWVLALGPVGSQLQALSILMSLGVCWIEATENDAGSAVCAFGGLGHGNSCLLSQKGLWDVSSWLSGGTPAVTLWAGSMSSPGQDCHSSACVAEKAAPCVVGGGALPPPPPHVGSVLDTSIQWPCAVSLWTMEALSSGCPAEAFGVQGDAVGVAGVWLESSS